jgi:hypothetical protein
VLYQGYFVALLVLGTLEAPVCADDSYPAARQRCVVRFVFGYVCTGSPGTHAIPTKLPNQ